MNDGHLSEENEIGGFATIVEQFLTKDDRRLRDTEHARV
jgi:hypothetical protein